MGSRTITAKILNIAFSMTHTFTFTTYGKIIPSFQLLDSFMVCAPQYNSITIIW
jgi:hypothetical protein